MKIKFYGTLKNGSIIELATEVSDEDTEYDVDETIEVMQDSVRECFLTDKNAYLKINETYIKVNAFAAIEIKKE